MQERTDRCEHPCRGQRRLQCTDAPAKSGSRKFADFFLQGGLPIRESRLTRWDRFVYTQSRRRECCDHIPAWERVSPRGTSTGRGPAATPCRTGRRRGGRWRRIYFIKSPERRSCKRFPYRLRHKRFKRRGTSSRSEERRVGKECRSRWSPYH